MSPRGYGEARAHDTLWHVFCHGQAGAKRTCRRYGAGRRGSRWSWLTSASTRLQAPESRHLKCRTRSFPFSCEAVAFWQEQDEVELNRCMPALTEGVLNDWHCGMTSTINSIALHCDKPHDKQMKDMSHEGPCHSAKVQSGHGRSVHQSSLRRPDTACTRSWR